MRYILSVDIGGSKLLVGIVDGQTGTVMAKEKYVFGKTYTQKELFDAVFRLCDGMMQYDPGAIGVSIPGLADADKGMWVYAPFSGLKDIPVARIFQNRYSLPVFVENDVNICALGEQMYVACKNDSDFLWVTVSNGIGGALVLNHTLYEGAGSHAGEIGHFIVEEPSVHRCGCGHYGCLEAVASGNAVAKRYHALTGHDRKADEIAELAREGDTAAMEIYRSVGTFLGKGISYCVNILNLKKVILGGGVVKSMALFEPALKESLGQYVFQGANPDVTVESSPLGYEAALIGCAALCKMKAEKRRKDDVSSC